MKKIKLNDLVDIYVADIINYDKEVLKKQLIKNFEFSSGSEKEGLDISGEQSILMFDSAEINNIKNQCIKHIQSIDNDFKVMYCGKNWIYINDSKTKEAFYHEHIQNKTIPILKNEWIYTFYLQMPNNLNGDEGYLFFKTNDGVEHKILPIEGQVIIFPSHLLHKPELSPNTQQKRIVFGGAYSKIDINKSYSKLNKTLF